MVICNFHSTEDLANLDIDKGINNIVSMANLLIYVKSYIHFSFKNIFGHDSIGFRFIMCLDRNVVEEEV